MYNIHNLMINYAYWGRLVIDSRKYIYINTSYTCRCGETTDIWNLKISIMYTA